MLNKNLQSGFAGLGILVGIASVLVISSVWTIIFGFVDTLPWGMEEVTQLMSNTLSVVYTSIPLLEAPFEYFLIAIGIKISLLTIAFTMWIMSLISLKA